MQPSDWVVRCSTLMNDRLHGRRGGRFIVLTGPDGVGKTTVAHHVLRLSAGETAYFHFRPPIGRAMASGPPEVPDPPTPKPPSSGSVVLGWVRLGRNLIRFWIGYLVSLRPALRRGATVVGDRWAYGYLAQPDALKFYGPAWLARVAVVLFPQPDLVANLRASAETIHGRKAELSLDQIRSELEAWARIPGAVDIDASGGPEAVAHSIVGRFE